MEQNNMTAVEWLKKEVEEYGDREYLIIRWTDLDELINQSKQMEKEHHEQTWNVAHQAGRFEGKGIAEENWQRFEQYYNETFGKS